MTTFDLNMDFVRASTLMLQQYDRLNLMLVGCGGTGSWLAPAVVRVARLLQETQAKDVRLYFIDPDWVEEKNIYRQNFCQAEFGSYKAETLAFRLGAAWGMEITAITKKLQDIGDAGNIGYQSNEITLVVGCVDRPSARREIRTFLERRRHGWWLDCGNEANTGQVLIGADDRKPKEPFSLPGICSWLPLPSLQHPELVEEHDGEALEMPALSCAEMALRDSQGLAINQRVAAEAADYLVRMLITRDLQKMATYLDLSSGSARSVYITPEVVGKYE